MDVTTARRATPEKEWWLRSLAVFQSPASVFAWLRDESDRQAEARQEPILALVWLAGIAGLLASRSAGTLLDPASSSSLLPPLQLDGLDVALFLFLGGGLYGAATFWIGGGAVYLGARAAGGEGSYRRARHLLAFAAAPLVLSLLVVWPLRLAVYGSDVFRAGGTDELGAARWVFEGVEAALFLWALALLVLALRVVHDWPLVRALGALALAGFALVAFALVLILL